MMKHMCVHSYACLTVFLHVCVDSGSSNPLHSEEHQKEPWCEGLAMVEYFHHSATPH